MSNMRSPRDYPGNEIRGDYSGFRLPRFIGRRDSLNETSGLDGSNSDSNENQLILNRQTLGRHLFKARS